jgi:hypothetical protein
MVVFWRFVTRETKHQTLIPRTKVIYTDRNLSGLLV